MKKLTAREFVIGILIFILLVAAISGLCSCTTLARVLDVIPEGKHCLVVETTHKRIEVCISKTTTYKPTAPVSEPIPKEDNP